MKTYIQSPQFAAMKVICFFTALILFQIFIQKQRVARAAFPLMRLEEKIARHYWKRVQEQEKRALKKAQLQKALYSSLQNSKTQ